MAKTPITLAPDLSADRPRRRLAPLLPLVVLVPLLAPFLLDATTLCYSGWRQILGTPVAVRTATFDAIGEGMAVVREEIRFHVASRFDRVPWEPHIVLPVAVVVMLGSMTLLRR